MKISMWMIAEKMKQYNPQSNISDGSARITGVRFLFGQNERDMEPQFVYLRLLESSAALINGPDSIIFQNQDADRILNDLMEVFDFYNAWEKTLWDTSTNKSFQQIIDLGHDVLDNPMMVSDMDGNILAISSDFTNEDSNACRAPTAVLSTPMYSPDGTPAFWTDTPNIYVLPDGTKIMGTYLRSGGSPIAIFRLREYKRPILPCDAYLMQMLCDVMTSTLEAQPEAVPVCPDASILNDLLAGNPVDDDSILHLGLKLKVPCRLLVISIPIGSSRIYQRFWEQHLLAQELYCVSSLYEDYVIALTSDTDACTILNSVADPQDTQYQLTGISLPFEDLHDIPFHYAQTLFALTLAGNKPGIYRAEDSALQYLLSLVTRQVPKQCLIHPALLRLKRYDEGKENGLYETLRQYLLNERSITQCAQAMHMHKNSLMYRLQRIQSMIDVDLNDPTARTYLLLSYLMDKS